MQDYDNYIWIVNDELLWVKNDEPIWIPNILDDGSVVFVFKDVGYHNEALSNKYKFVSKDTKYCSTSEHVKYNFVANKIEGWHQP